MSQYTEIELLEAERDKWIDICKEMDDLNNELLNALLMVLTTDLLSDNQKSIFSEAQLYQIRIAVKKAFKKQEVTI